MVPRHQHGKRQTTDINTDSSYYRATDPDTALSSSSVPMSPLPQVAAQVTQISLFFTTFTSPSLLLSVAHERLSFSLSHFSITDFLIIMMPTCMVTGQACGCLQWVQTSKHTCCEEELWMFSSYLGRVGMCVSSASPSYEAQNWWIFVVNEGHIIVWGRSSNGRPLNW